MTPFRFFLDWEVNCQFAGLLRAREDGLFARAGLAVDLVPPSACPGAGVLELVRQGGLCAGCMEDNLIVRAVLAGGDVRAIGATMQDSPMVLMTAREGGIADLAGLAALEQHVLDEVGRAVLGGRLLGRATVHPQVDRGDRRARDRVHQDAESGGQSS